MFLDACFSGGATRAKTRDYALPGAAPEEKLVPKFIPGDDCSQPVNVTRDYRVLQPKWGAAVDNYIHIAAARQDEASFSGRSGSVATVAWRQCLEEGAADGDGSGGITAEEIRRCAQPRIEARAPGFAPDRPHHITLTGNTDTVLDLRQDRVPEPAPARPDARATLEDLYRSRDARRTVEATAEQDRLRIGQDWLRFSVASAQAGHVYVLMAGSDGHTFDLLFPNAEDSDNRIEAGQTLDLPRPHWRLRAAGPEGEDRLLVLVAPEPRDFSRLITARAGPFASIAATGPSTAGVQSVAGAAACDSGPACDYGAALLRLRELP